MSESKPAAPLEIQLNKLYLWVEPPRYYLYPQYLSSNTLDAQATYTEEEVKTQVFERLLVPQKGNPDKLRARRGSLINNVFGLEVRSPDSVRLRGINLFRRVESAGEGTPAFRLSLDGQRLAEAYRQDKEGVTWRGILAQVLAKFEPRTRILLHCLGHLGYRLRFSNRESADSSFFSYPARAALLCGPDAAPECLQVLRPVRVAKGEVPPINTLMRDHLAVAIGPHWLAELQSAGIVTDRPWILHGSVGPEPSDDEIGVYLKCPLGLLRDLQILRFQDGDWFVDLHNAWTHLGSEVCSDLLPEAQTADFYSVLRRQYAVLQDEERMAQAALLAQQVCQELVISQAEFDRQLLQLIYDGRVRLGRSWRGQLRHGRGLFGEVDKQFVELFFS